MKHGYYSDRELPKSVGINKAPIIDYKTNSHGYRCPEWEPMPDGKKNVVVLGCSHTFGQGNADNEHWVHFLSQHNTDRLRYWNLGQPGASADKVVRILYSCEKVIHPRIVIVCWPFWSRREKLHAYPQSQMSYDPELKNENDLTDKNNFLKNVFFVEKFALIEKDLIIIPLMCVMCVALPFVLVTIAPRFIPAEEVNLFFLLETIIGPIWVWLVIKEQPSIEVLQGGLVIIITIAIHSFLKLKKS